MLKTQLMPLTEPKNKNSENKSPIFTVFPTKTNKTETNVMN